MIIYITIVLSFSIGFNILYFINSRKRDGFLVLIKRPNGKRAIRIQPNTEPDDLRVGQKYVLKIIAGEDDMQEELPFAE